MSVLIINGATKNIQTKPVCNELMADVLLNSHHAKTEVLARVWWWRFCILI